MKATISALLLAVLAVGLTGCGGGGSSSTAKVVAITMIPTGASLLPNQTQQFTATVTGSSNTSVTWQVNGITGGNASIGTIDTTGLYTAPASVPLQVSNTITAISQADTTKTATGTVILSPEPAGYQPGITVSPPSATVPAGGQQNFVATVNGAPATGVTWTVSCTPSGSDCGAINATTGSYTAPLAPSSGGSITVTATASGTSSGNAAITVQYSNATLSGQYAFVLTGQVSTGGYTAIVGSMNLDGQGNVTGGKEDVSATAGPSAIIGGTYHVGTDGRGNATITTAAGSMTLQFAMQNHAHAEAVVFSTNTVAAGTLDLQDATQFLSSAVSGNYAFLMSGASGANPANSLQRVGVAIADGAGTITGGLMDKNDFGTASAAIALSGTYTAPDADGRGVLTLAGVGTIAYYVVDGTRLKLLDTGLSTPSAGEAARQAAGPFTAASLNGSFATVMAGADGTGPVGKGAIFSLDGVSAVGGLVDLNSNGNVPSGYSGGGALSGSYAVADAVTGRTTMSWTEPAGARSLVLYPGASGAAYVMETDTLAVAGKAYQQATSAAGFTGSTASGTFVTRATGIAFSGTPGPQAFAGTVAPSGGSSVSATLDINSVGVTSSSAAFTGSYLVAANGRVTANVPSPTPTSSNPNLVWYVVNSGRVLYMEVDSNRVESGVMVKRQ